jgi:uncharacterized protein YceK
MRNILIAAVAATILSGCASIGPASVRNGECRVFHDPGFAVRGKRLQDAQWIGRTQETGIKVCGWKRPRA